MYPENVADLFDSLDLEREGLREAGDAWKRGDKAEACRLLLDYYGGSEADCSVSLSVGQKNPYFHGWYSALQTKIHSSICGQYEGKVEAEGDFARLRANVESLPTSEVAVDFAGKRLPSYAEVKVEK